MSKEDQELNQLMERYEDQVVVSKEVKLKRTEGEQPPSQRSNGIDGSNVSISQWGADINDRFRPCGPSHSSIPAGIYRFDGDNRGIYVEKLKLVTDNLLELDDESSVRVLKSIYTFWDRKKEYESRGIIYKRGILLWGPAGSGKTALITLLIQELIRRDGVVIICSHVANTLVGLPIFRRIEPDRSLIVIFEDIDELIKDQSEHMILALLDGEHQVGNVVNLATTNFPERLGARIVNRPSRFDERIRVGMPSANARMKYLKSVTGHESLTSGAIVKWVSDTEGFSVAHIRELVVAVFCLKQDYDDVLERLKSMQSRPKSLPEFASNGIGFDIMSTKGDS